MPPAAKSLAAPSVFVGDAAGISVADSKNGRQLATGRLKDVPADSPAGEVLASLRGAPGLSAAQSDPASTVSIEFQDDRVYRVLVVAPGGAPATVLNSPGGLTVRDAREANAAGVLEIPRNGALRIRGVDGHGETRTIDLTGPFGQLPGAGPLSGAAAAIRAALQENPAAGAAPLDESSPVTLKTDTVGQLKSFSVPGKFGAVFFSRPDGSASFTPVPGQIPASVPPAVTPAVAASASEKQNPAVRFLLGDDSSSPFFVRALADGKTSEVTLGASTLAKTARAQIARELPRNPLAARVGSGAERPGENIRVTVGERDGGVKVLGLVPAASIPRTESAAPLLAGTPVDPAADANAAQARLAVLGSGAPTAAPGAPGMNVTRRDPDTFALLVPASDLGPDARAAVQRALDDRAKTSPVSMNRVAESFGNNIGSVEMTVRVNGGDTEFISASFGGIPLALSRPAPVSTEIPSEPAPDAGPAAVARYFKSGDIPAVSGTGADARTGQHALPASYVSALTSARTAIANIPPASMMSFQAAVNTARVRLNDLSAAYTRLDGDDGFLVTPEANLRRGKVFGSSENAGSIAAMNRTPSPEKILRAFSDLAAMNQYRR